jgi:hypothetical protein
VIKLQETHTPAPGQQHEPSIAWVPGQVIDTREYFDQIEDSLVIVARVTATSLGGTAVDSVRVTLVRASRPPVIDSVRTSTGDDFFAVGSTVTLEGYYHDDDDDVVSAEWETEVVLPPVFTKTTGADAWTATAQASTAVATNEEIISKLGENRFTFVVRDASGHEVREELVIEGIEPCSNVPPVFDIRYFQENGSNFCGPGKGGATGFEAQPALGLSVIEACLNPTRDCWTLRIRGVSMNIIYGWCPKSFRPGIKLVNSTPTNITKAEACKITAEFREHIRQLAAGRALEAKEYLSNDAIVKHEQVHAKRLEQYLREAVAIFQQGLQDSCLSKKRARNSFEARSILKGDKAQDDLRNEFVGLKVSFENSSERAARRKHIDELNKLVSQIEARYGRCQ